MNEKTETAENNASENRMSALLRFGTGMFVALVVVGSSSTAVARDKPEEACRPAWIAPLAVAYAQLATLPTVQKELKLTADQEVTIKAAADKMKAANDRLKAAFQESLRPLRQPGGREKLREPNKQKYAQAKEHKYAQAEEIKKTLDATLSPEQMGRLKGMVLRWVGMLAINDSDIQQELALSDDQVAKIRAINANLEGDLRQSPNSSGASVTKTKSDILDYEKQLKNVLTDDQQSLFRKMQGGNLVIPLEEMKTLY